MQRTARAPFIRLMLTGNDSAIYGHYIVYSRPGSRPMNSLIHSSHHLSHGRVVYACLVHVSLLCATVTVKLAMKVKLMNDYVGW